MNPDAPRLATTYGRIPEGFLDNLAHTVRRGDPLLEPPDPVFALSFGHDKPVDRARFLKAISELGDDLLRLKGQVDFGGGPEFAEVAGGRLTLGGKQTITRPAEFPTAFVAIGWRTPREDFQAAIESSWT
jgi:G3E family GTPase